MVKAFADLRSEIAEKSSLPIRAFLASSRSITVIDVSALLQAVEDRETQLRATADKREASEKKARKRAAEQKAAVENAAAERKKAAEKLAKQQADRRRAATAPQPRTSDGSSSGSDKSGTGDPYPGIHRTTLLRPGRQNLAPLLTSRRLVHPYDRAGRSSVYPVLPGLSTPHRRVHGG